MREAFAKAHPFVQLIIIVALGFGCMFVLFVLVMIPLFVNGSGLDVLTSIAQEEHPGRSTILFMKFLQIAQALGLFVAPFLFYRYFGLQPSYRWAGSRVWPVLLFTMVMASAFPLVNWLALVNSNLHLPEFMAGIEEWIYETEANAEALIKQFLHMETAGDLAFNLFLVALVPAVSEELFFRGAVQPIFQRIFRNGHLAVWVTAFAFSFFHLQFLGFVPRFVLGALLGYAALWTNTLFVPVAGHFTNNALAVLMAWFLGEESLETDYSFFETGAQTIGLALVSLVTVATGMLLLRKQAK